jgi:glyoxylase-like metal-dependent hydrolase (beta-lactamase superfamily II)
MRLSVFPYLLLGLTVFATARADDGFTLTPVAPAARTFQLGKLQVTALHDAQLAVPNDGKSFGLGATVEQVAEVLRTGGAATDQVILSVNALMVKGDGRLILIDAGTGPEWHGALQDSLKLAGIAPRAVTDVLITHSHGDHVNGLLDPKGGLAFPNATIRMSDE